MIQMRNGVKITHRQNSRRGRIHFTALCPTMTKPGQGIARKRRGLFHGSRKLTRGRPFRRAKAAGSQFEKATEHKLSIQWGAAVPLKAEIEKGAAFDVAVLTVGGIDDLIKQGKLASDSRADLGRSELGIGIRAGAVGAGAPDARPR